MSPNHVSWMKDPTPELLQTFGGGHLYVPREVEDWHGVHKQNLRYELHYCDDPRVGFAEHFKTLGWKDPEVEVFRGNRTRIHHTAILGRRGFGFARTHRGHLLPMPHVGHVTLRDGVEVGAHTCIDRGCLTDTIVGAGSKIDNLVHIAHGVVIGEGCWVAAGAVLAGSVVLEAGVQVGINASILPGVRVGQGAVVGAGAVVTKDVPSGRTVMGNPARSGQP